jgi:hypothetical protein
VSILKRLARASVWAPGNIRPEDWRFRGIFRFVLPVTNLIFLYFGVVGFFNGVGSVSDATSAAYAAFWSAGIAFVSVGCLVGVSFPKLGPLELVSKVLLISLVASYVAVLAVRSFHLPASQATAGLLLVLIILPLWRVLDLGVQLRNHPLVQRLKRRGVRPRDRKAAKG